MIDHLDDNILEQMKVRSDECCISIELVEAKGFVFLKVVVIKNVLFVTIVF